MPHAGAPSTVVFTVGFGDVFRHYGACGCRSILHAYGESLRALLVATDAATARAPRPPPLGDARVELVPMLSAPSDVCIIVRTSSNGMRTTVSTVRPNIAA